MIHTRAKVVGIVQETEETSPALIGPDEWPSEEIRIYIKKEAED